MICQVKIWLLKTDSFAHPYLPFWKLFWAYCNRTEHFCSVSHCRSYKNCKYVSYRNLFDHPHKHRVQTRLVSECARLGLLFESHGVMSLDDFADPCRHYSASCGGAAFISWPVISCECWCYGKDWGHWPWLQIRNEMRLVPGLWLLDGKTWQQMPGHRDRLLPPASDSCMVICTAAT